MTRQQCIVGMFVGAAIFVAGGDPAWGETCSTDQCATLAENDNRCGGDAPFACLDDTQRGCWDTAANATSKCKDSTLWCDASHCDYVAVAPKAVNLGQCNPELCGEWGKLIGTKDGNPHDCNPTNQYTCADKAGGCYPDPASVTKTMCPKICDVGSCWWYHGAAKFQRPSRNITVVNNCHTALDLYWTEGLTLAEAGVVKQNRSQTHFAFITAAAGETVSKPFPLQEASNSYGQKFYSFQGEKQLGINFWAMPADKDVANTTLFEINFSANGGAADYYDISAIPPGSCAAHLSPADNDYGYADHLPFKDPTHNDTWACLHYTSGTNKGSVISGTCGDGVGWELCPAVDGTTVPPQAKAGVGGNKGCGVGVCCASWDGAKCTGIKTGVDCCPNVCGTEVSTTDIQEWMKSDPSKVHQLRNEVYACALRQAAQVAKDLKEKLTGGGTPRQTGFYKGLRVEPVKHDPSQNLDNCPTRTCTAGDPMFSNMGKTCEGYLWPYDDAFGLIRCTATPDYKLTFCPDAS